MGQTRPAAACCVAEPFGDLALAIKARADSFSHPEFLAGGAPRSSPLESLRTRTLSLTATAREAAGERAERDGPRGAQGQ